ncbi:MAG: peptide ABC transporter permease [Clostridioides sp.]|jgi:hypothetical protein|nr:peptide ABC transporter permease [Clostridioides sp.]
MKIFKLFITRIFLRRAILSVSVLGLVFIANYISFISARSIFSTLEGYREVKCINQEGNFVANLDPDSDINMDVITDEKAQIVYSFLADKFKYAFCIDGFVIDLPNDDGMDISLSYMNEEYYKIKQFELLDGEDLDFGYQLDKDESIPVLVGNGLSKKYPVGSLIKIKEPALEKTVTLKVKGVLKQNLYRPNFYLLNSKQYYNFSIFLPVNNEFIEHSNTNLTLNGLMDLIVLETNQEKIMDLKKVIHDNLDLKFNFHSQKENLEYFNEYFFSSLKFISLITVILLIVITCISLWSALVGIRLMLRDFTINFLVGLSYSGLRKIFYIYYGILFFIDLIIIFLITASSRYKHWLNKEAYFATYGTFGLVSIDWFALLAVVFFDIIIGIIIVETIISRVKKVPISLGVLQ